MILVAQRPLLAKFPDGLPLRYSRPNPSHNIRWLGNCGLLAKHLGLCAKPIFEIVTVFKASVLVEPIRTGRDYIFGQFE
jgi:hypothetical protein